MSKRERDRKEDEGDDSEKRVKVSSSLEKHSHSFLAFLKSEYEKKCSVEDRNGGETYLHYAACLGHVEATSILLQNGASINAVDNDNCTALHYAAEDGNVDVVSVLPIKDRLKSLRDGKGMKTTLMSDEERQFMIHVAWFLDRKCPEATFKAYYAIRSFITFHGIFMGLEYHLGAASIWYLE